MPRDDLALDVLSPTDACRLTSRGHSVVNGAGRVVGRVDDHGDGFVVVAWTAKRKDERDISVFSPDSLRRSDIVAL